MFGWPAVVSLFAIIIAVLFSVNPTAGTVIDCGRVDPSRSLVNNEHAFFYVKCGWPRPTESGAAGFPVVVLRHVLEGRGDQA